MPKRLKDKHTKILTIIIVTYNSEKYIKRCLESLKQYKKDMTKDIMIVDNNSSDNTLKIAKIFNINIIKNKQNLGYAKAANIGIKKAGSRYILLINPDIYFEKDTIKDMLDFMKNNQDCDIQGPKLFDENKNLIFSCKRFPTIKAILGRRLKSSKIFKQDVKRYLMKDYNHKKPRKVDWVSGGCMMFKKNFSFDNRYFLYFEDVDFCHGKNVYYNPKAIAHHTVQRESSKNIRFLYYHTISFVKYKIKYLF